MTTPFDTLPDTSEVAALEARVRELLTEAFGIYYDLYAPETGTRPRETPEAAIASATGTLMLRLVELGYHQHAAKAPDAVAVKVRGDLAILVARSAGYLVRDFTDLIKPGLAKVMTAEMLECAGFGRGREAPHVLRAN